MENHASYLLSTALSISRTNTQASKRSTNSESTTESWRRFCDFTDETKNDGTGNGGVSRYGPEARYPTQPKLDHRDNAEFAGLIDEDNNDIIVTFEPPQTGTAVANSVTQMATSEAALGTVDEQGEWEPHSPSTSSQNTQTPWLSTPANQVVTGSVTQESVSQSTTDVDSKKIDTKTIIPPIIIIIIPATTRRTQFFTPPLLTPLIEIYNESPPATTNVITGHTDSTYTAESADTGTVFLSTTATVTLEDFSGDPTDVTPDTNWTDINQPENVTTGMMSRENTVLAHTGVNTVTDSNLGSHSHPATVYPEDRANGQLNQSETIENTHSTALPSTDFTSPIPTRADKDGYISTITFPTTRGPCVIVVSSTPSELSQTPMYPNTVQSMGVTNSVPPVTSSTDNLPHITVTMEGNVTGFNETNSSLPLNLPANSTDMPTLFTSMTVSHSQYPTNDKSQNSTGDNSTTSNDLYSTTTVDVNTTMMNNNDLETTTVVSETIGNRSFEYPTTGEEYSQTTNAATEGFTTVPNNNEMINTTRNNLNARTLVSQSNNNSLYVTSAVSLSHEDTSVPPVYSPFDRDKNTSFDTTTNAANHSTNSLYSSTLTWDMHTEFNSTTTPTLLNNTSLPDSNSTTSVNLLTSDSLPDINSTSTVPTELLNPMSSESVQSTAEVLNSADALELTQTTTSSINQLTIDNNLLTTNYLEKSVTNAPYTTTDHTAEHFITNALPEITAVYSNSQLSDFQDEDILATICPSTEQYTEYITATISTDMRTDKSNTNTSNTDYLLNYTNVFSGSTDPTQYHTSLEYISFETADGNLTNSTVSVSSGTTLPVVHTLTENNFANSSLVISTPEPTLLESTITDSSTAKSTIDLQTTVNYLDIETTITSQELSSPKTSSTTRPSSTTTMPTLSSSTTSHPTVTIMEPTVTDSHSTTYPLTTLSESSTAKIEIPTTAPSTGYPTTITNSDVSSSETATMSHPRTTESKAILSTTPIATTTPISSYTTPPSTIVGESTTNPASLPTTITTTTAPIIISSATSRSLTSETISAEIVTTEIPNSTLHIISTHQTNLPTTYLNPSSLPSTTVMSTVKQSSETAITSHPLTTESKAVLSTTPKTTTTPISSDTTPPMTIVGESTTNPASLPTNITPTTPPIITSSATSKSLTSEIISAEIVTTEIPNSTLHIISTHQTNLPTTYLNPSSLPSTTVMSTVKQSSETAITSHPLTTESTAIMSSTPIPTTAPISSDTTPPSTFVGGSTTNPASLPTTIMTTTAPIIISSATSRSLTSEIISADIVTTEIPNSTLPITSNRQTSLPTTYLNPSSLPSTNVKPTVKPSSETATTSHPLTTESKAVLSTTPKTTTTPISSDTAPPMTIVGESTTNPASLPTNITPTTHPIITSSARSKSLTSEIISAEIVTTEIPNSTLHIISTHQTNLPTTYLNPSSLSSTTVMSTVKQSSETATTSHPLTTESTAIMSSTPIPTTAPISSDTTRPSTFVGGSTTNPASLPTTIMTTTAPIIISSATSRSLTSEIISAEIVTTEVPISTLHIISTHQTSLPTTYLNPSSLPSTTVMSTVKQSSETATTSHPLTTESTAIMSSAPMTTTVPISSDTSPPTTMVGESTTNPASLPTTITPKSPPIIISSATSRSRTSEIISADIVATEIPISTLHIISTHQTNLTTYLNPSSLPSTTVMSTVKPSSETATTSHPLTTESTAIMSSTPMTTTAPISLDTTPPSTFVGESTTNPASLPTTITPTTLPIIISSATSKSPISEIISADIVITEIPNSTLPIISAHQTNLTTTYLNPSSLPSTTVIPTPPLNTLFTSASLQPTTDIHTSNIANPMTNMQDAFSEETADLPITTSSPASSKDSIITILPLNRTTETTNRFNLTLSTATTESVAPSMTNMRTVAITGTTGTTRSETTSNGNTYPRTNIHNTSSVTSPVAQTSTLHFSLTNDTSSTSTLTTSPSDTSIVNTENAYNPTTTMSDSPPNTSTEIPHLNTGNLKLFTENTVPATTPLTPSTSTYSTSSKHITENNITTEHTTLILHLSTAQSPSSETSLTSSSLAAASTSSIASSDYANTSSKLLVSDTTGQQSTTDISQISQADVTSSLQYQSTPSSTATGHTSQIHITSSNASEDILVSTPVYPLTSLPARSSTSFITKSVNSSFEPSSQTDITSTVKNEETLASSHALIITSISSHSTTKVLTEPITTFSETHITQSTKDNMAITNDIATSSLGARLQTFSTTQSGSPPYAPTTQPYQSSGSGEDFTTQLIMNNQSATTVQSTPDIVSSLGTTASVNTSQSSNTTETTMFGTDTTYMAYMASNPSSDQNKFHFTQKSTDIYQAQSSPNSVPLSSLEPQLRDDTTSHMLFVSTSTNPNMNVTLINQQETSTRIGKGTTETHTALPSIITNEVNSTDPQVTVDNTDDMLFSTRKQSSNPNFTSGLITLSSSIADHPQEQMTHTTEYQKTGAAQYTSSVASRTDWLATDDRVQNTAATQDTYQRSNTHTTPSWNSEQTYSFTTAHADVYTVSLPPRTQSHIPTRSVVRNGTLTNAIEQITVLETSISGVAEQNSVVQGSTLLMDGHATPQVTVLQSAQSSENVVTKPRDVKQSVTSLVPSVTEKAAITQGPTHDQRVTSQAATEMTRQSSSNTVKYISQTGTQLEAELTKLSTVNTSSVTQQSIIVQTSTEPERPTSSTFTQKQTFTNHNASEQTSLSIEDISPATSTYITSSERIETGSTSTQSKAAIHLLSTQESWDITTMYYEALTHSTPTEHSTQILSGTVYMETGNPQTLTTTISGQTEHSTVADNVVSSEPSMPTTVEHSTEPINQTATAHVVTTLQQLMDKTVTVQVQTSTESAETKQSTETGHVLSSESVVTDYSTIIHVGTVTPFTGTFGNTESTVIQTGKPNQSGLTEDSTLLPTSTGLTNFDHFQHPTTAWNGMVTQPVDQSTTLPTTEAQINTVLQTMGEITHTIVSQTDISGHAEQITEVQTAGMTWQSAEQTTMATDTVISQETVTLHLHSSTESAETKHSTETLPVLSSESVVTDYSKIIHIGTVTLFTGTVGNTESIAIQTGMPTQSGLTEESTLLPTASGLTNFDHSQQPTTAWNGMVTQPGVTDDSTEEQMSTYSQTSGDNEQTTVPYSVPIQLEHITDATLSTGTFQSEYGHTDQSTTLPTTEAQISTILQTMGEITHTIVSQTDISGQAEQRTEVQTAGMTWQSAEQTTMATDTVISQETVTLHLHSSTESAETKHSTETLPVLSSDSVVTDYSTIIHIGIVTLFTGTVGNTESTAIQTGMPNQSGLTEESTLLPTASGLTNFDHSQQPTTAWNGMVTQPGVTDDSTEEQMSTYSQTSGDNEQTTVPYSVPIQLEHITDATLSTGTFQSEYGHTDQSTTLPTTEAQISTILQTMGEITHTIVSQTDISGQAEQRTEVQTAGMTWQSAEQTTMATDTVISQETVTVHLHSSTESAEIKHSTETLPVLSSESVVTDYSTIIHIDTVTPFTVTFGNTESTVIQTGKPNQSGLTEDSTLLPTGTGVTNFDHSQQPTTAWNGMVTQPGVTDDSTEEQMSTYSKTSGDNEQPTVPNSVPTQPEHLTDATSLPTGTFLSEYGHTDQSTTLPTTEAQISTILQATGGITHTIVSQTDISAHDEQSTEVKTAGMTWQSGNQTTMATDTVISQETATVHRHSSTESAETKHSTETLPVLSSESVVTDYSTIIHNDTVTPFSGTVGNTESTVIQTGKPNQSGLTENITLLPTGTGVTNFDHSQQPTTAWNGMVTQPGVTDDSTEEQMSTYSQTSGDNEQTTVPSYSVPTQPEHLTDATSLPTGTFLSAYGHTDQSTTLPTTEAQISTVFQTTGEITHTIISQTDISGHAEQRTEVQTAGMTWQSGNQTTMASDTVISQETATVHLHSSTESAETKHSTETLPVLSSESVVTDYSTIIHIDTVTPFSGTDGNTESTVIQTGKPNQPGLTENSTLLPTGTGLANFDHSQQPTTAWNGMVTQPGVTDDSTEEQMSTYSQTSGDNEQTTVPYSVPTQPEHLTDATSVPTGTFLSEYGHTDQSTTLPTTEAQISTILQATGEITHTIVSQTDISAHDEQSTEVQTAGMTWQSGNQNTMASDTVISQETATVHLHSSTESAEIKHSTETLPVLSSESVVTDYSTIIHIDTVTPFTVTFGNTESTVIQTGKPNQSGLTEDSTLLPTGTGVTNFDHSQQPTTAWNGMVTQPGVTDDSTEEQMSTYSQTSGDNEQTTVPSYSVPTQPEHLTDATSLPTGTFLSAYGHTDQSTTLPTTEAQISTVFQTTGEITHTIISQTDISGHAEQRTEVQTAGMTWQSGNQTTMASDTVISQETATVHLHSSTESAETKHSTETLPVLSSESVVTDYSTIIHIDTVTPFSGTDGNTESTVIQTGKPNQPGLTENSTLLPTGTGLANFDHSQQPTTAWNGMVTQPGVTDDSTEEQMSTYSQTSGDNEQTTVPYSVPTQPEHLTDATSVPTGTFLSKYGHTDQSTTLPTTEAQISTILQATGEITHTIVSQTDISAHDEQSTEVQTAGMTWQSGNQNTMASDTVISQETATVHLHSSTESAETKHSTETLPVLSSESVVTDYSTIIHVGTVTPFTVTFGNTESTVIQTGKPNQSGLTEDSTFLPTGTGLTNFDHSQHPTTAWNGMVTQPGVTDDSTEERMSTYSQTSGDNEQTTVPSYSVPTQPEHLTDATSLPTGIFLSEYGHTDQSTTLPTTEAQISTVLQTTGEITHTIVSQTDISGHAEQRTEVQTAGMTWQSAEQTTMATDTVISQETVTLHLHSSTESAETKHSTETLRVLSSESVVTDYSTIIHIDTVTPFSGTVGNTESTVIQTGKPNQSGLTENITLLPTSTGVTNFDHSQQPTTAWNGMVTQPRVTEDSTEEQMSTYSKTSGDNEQPTVPNSVPTQPEHLTDATSLPTGTFLSEYGHTDQSTTLPTTEAQISTILQTMGEITHTIVSQTDISPHDEQSTEVQTAGMTWQSGNQTTMATDTVINQETVTLHLHSSTESTETKHSTETLPVLSSESVVTDYSKIIHVGTVTPFTGTVGNTESTVIQTGKTNQSGLTEDSKLLPSGTGVTNFDHSQHPTTAWNGMVTQPGVTDDSTEEQMSTYSQTSGDNEQTTVPYSVPTQHEHLTDVASLPIGFFQSEYGHTDQSTTLSTTEAQISTILQTTGEITHTIVSQTDISAHDEQSTEVQTAGTTWQSAEQTTVMSVIIDQTTSIQIDTSIEYIVNENTKPILTHLSSVSEVTDYQTTIHTDTSTSETKGNGESTVDHSEKSTSTWPGTPSPGGITEGGTELVHTGTDLQDTDISTVEPSTIQRVTLFTETDKSHQNTVAQTDVSTDALLTDSPNIASSVLPSKVVVSKHTTAVYITIGTVMSETGGNGQRTEAPIHVSTQPVETEASTEAELTEYSTESQTSTVFSETGEPEKTTEQTSTEDRRKAYLETTTSINKLTTSLSYTNIPEKTSSPVTLITESLPRTRKTKSPKRPKPTLKPIKNDKSNSSKAEMDPKMVEAIKVSATGVTGGVVSVVLVGLVLLAIYVLVRYKR